MSENSNSNHARNGSVPPSSPSTPQVHHDVSSKSSDPIEPLNIDTRQDVQNTRLRTLRITPYLEETIKLTESEPKEIKFHTYRAQDFLLPLGKKDRDLYMVQKVLPLKSTVKMATYCVSKESRLNDIVVLLRSVGYPETVVICPVNYEYTTPEGSKVLFDELLVSKQQNK